MSSNRRRRILFFTPYATRTGSEMLLYYILKNLDRERFDAGLVCFSKGELLNDIPADIPVFVSSKDFSLTQKVMYHLGYHPIYNFIRHVSKKFKADIWYVNTIMLPEVVIVANELKIPVITHVHELSSMFSQVSKKDFQAIVEGSDVLIGCSDIVCKCLTEAGGREVKRLYSFLDLNEIRPGANKVKEIREGWGAKTDDYVWIMSGTSSERKGFDLLPEIALQFPVDKKIHLVWVGKLTDNGLVYWAEQRCKNIQNVNVHLIGPQKDDYFSYLDAADGFMMTSRQEPFGLVMVEAAWLGKPVVAFDSGGPSEFITPEIGSVVPNMDVVSFVKAMYFWQHNPEKYNQELAKNRAMRFSAEVGMAEWSKILMESIR